MGAGVILAPPLWATGAWVDNSWADGSWATEITTPQVFGDLTTLFSEYVQDLRDSVGALAKDSATLVMKDQPTVRSNSGTDDMNTAYARELS